MPRKRDCSRVPTGSCGASAGSRQRAKKSALSLNRGALEGPTRGGKNTCRSLLCNGCEPFSHSTKTLNCLRYCATLNPGAPDRLFYAGRNLLEESLMGPFRREGVHSHVCVMPRTARARLSQPSLERFGRRPELTKRISSSTSLARIGKQEESGFGCFARTADEPREQARMDCPPGLLVEPCSRPALCRARPGSLRFRAASLGENARSGETIRSPDC